ncbi:glycoside hydrolase domain-containing protein [Streptomyces sp. RB17]|uniref:glycoside hydrolase domain-containing protein n=1 Tax=Streptomyces sp. RB17 TaxID=2585197 RepID=UPI003A4C50E5
MDITDATARSQGATEADDAISQAQAIGIPADSVLYDDMEGYDNTNSSCSTGVLNYLSAWTDELHARG